MDGGGQFTLLSGCRRGKLLRGKERPGLRFNYFHRSGETAVLGGLAALIAEISTLFYSLCE